MKKRDHLFKKAKRSCSPAIWSKYHSIRNKVTQQLRSAKSAFFSNINQADPKSFWALFRCTNQSDANLPTPTHNGVSARTSNEKADLLNQFFASIFLPPLDGEELQQLTSDNFPLDLLCIVPEVTKQLKALNPKKATGPDGVSATMLKELATEIAPSLTRLFNLSLTRGKVPIE